MELPIYYLPPISWFSQYFSTGTPLLVIDEPYKKQSYRNHCIIDSPQGPLKLTIPVSYPQECTNRHALIKDIRISEHGDWRHKHWHALETSYYNSPYFEYLQDDFKPLYEQKFEYLADFNIKLTETCLNLLGASTLTRQQIEQVIKSHETVQKKTYPQVFAQKHGFIPDLSIVDLIFNMGNEAIFYL